MLPYILYFVDLHSSMVRLEMGHIFYLLFFHEHLHSSMVRLEIGTRIDKLKMLNIFTFQYG